jgi:hypothetical protein
MAEAGRHGARHLLQGCRTGCLSAAAAAPRAGPAAAWCCAAGRGWWPARDCSRGPASAESRARPVICRRRYCTTAYMLFVLLLPLSGTEGGLDQPASPARYKVDVSTTLNPTVSGAAGPNLLRSPTAPPRRPATGVSGCAEPSL